MTPAYIITAPDHSNVLAAVRRSVDSLTTQRCYGRALEAFCGFLVAEGRSTIDPQSVALYAAYMRDHGYSVSSQHQAIAAIRAFARQARELGAMSEDICHGICEIKISLGRRQPRKGPMCEVDQIYRLLARPKQENKKKPLLQLRDTVVLALICAGCRKREVPGLRIEQFEKVGGRYRLRGVGESPKTRNVPIPVFAATAIYDWLVAIGNPESGPLVRKLIYNGRRVAPEPITRSTVGAIFSHYTQQCHQAITSASLRRTMRDLWQQAGATEDEVAMAMGANNRIWSVGG